MGSHQTGLFGVKAGELRKRAHDYVKMAGVTPGHGADKQVVLNLLNAALATKLASAQRYRQHYFESDGVLAEDIRKNFLAHSKLEQAQAAQIGERIVQLGGDTDLEPHPDSESGFAEDLETMIKDDLVAERVAIEAYQEMVEYLERRDHTTRRLFERILDAEEAHARELSGMLAQVHRRIPHMAEQAAEIRS